MFLEFELHKEKPTENLFLQEILDIVMDTKKLFSLFQLMRLLAKKKWNLENKLWKELENKGIRFLNDEIIGIDLSRNNVTTKNNHKLERMPLIPLLWI